MEISNNLVPTLSSADSPSQLSDGNPPAPKSAKKKVPGEESSFDGALLATTLATPKAPAIPTPKAPGLPEGTEKVELSAKGKASANAFAKADGGAPVPTVASLFQAQAEKSANGPMASAFVAGPDQPWGSRWVFAGGNQPAPEEIEAIRTAGKQPMSEASSKLAAGTLSLDQLKKLVEQAKAQGGDESQLKQAAESTLQGMDSAIAALGGELESVRTNPVDADGNPMKSTPTVLGGAEFLSALQEAKTAASGASGGNAGGLGGRSKDDARAQAPVPAFDPSALASGPIAGAKPSLQVVPGGLAAPVAGGNAAEGNGRLEGGLRLASKDEPKLQTDTFYPNGMPLTAAPRPDGHFGAGALPQTITGHVVPGAMMRDRLTSESIRDVANGISGMSGAGGGEMRIKMNPGNLGELMIRVSTDGKDVGLKVQANDPAAKKVIEESLSSLRDSLASQNLALGRVDVTLAPASANSDFGQGSQQSSNGHHQAFAGFDGQSSNQRRSMDGFAGGGDDRSSRSYEGGDRAVSRGVSSRIAAMGGAGASARAAASSRLDVMA